MSIFNSGLGLTNPIGFIPASDLGAARSFYEGVLGLTLVSNDGYGLVMRTGDMVMRIVQVPEFTPQPFTIFGWEVENVEGSTQHLVALGVNFQQYDFMDQSEDGVWTAPNGDKVAWFADQDNNILSLSSHR